MLATLTFAMGSVADISGSPRLFLIKNTLSMCSAPMEVLISVLYWSISAVCVSECRFYKWSSLTIPGKVDRSLVLPDWAVLPPPLAGEIDIISY